MSYATLIGIVLERFLPYCAADRRGPRQTLNLPPQERTHTHAVEFLWQVEIVTEERTEHRRQHQRAFPDSLPVLRARYSRPWFRAARQKHVCHLLARYGAG